MSQSDGQHIDIDAQRIYEPTFTHDWIIRHRYPDHHIDYLIELYENKEPLNIEFAVQLKGIQLPKRLSKVVRHPKIKTKDLKYWYEYPLPVFLVVVDVVIKEGWWVFIQQMIHEDKLKSGWRTQASVYIDLPLQNVIGNLPALKNAVQESVSYMKDVRPGKIRPAIQAVKARMEALDPRFNVKINPTDENTRFTIIPKGPPVTLHLTFHATDLEDYRANIARPLNRGEPIILTPSRLEVSGSKLFEESLGKAVSIVFQRQSEADVKLRVSDGEYLIDSLKGKLTAGMKNVRVNCFVSPDVFSLFLEFHPPDEHDGQVLLKLNIRVSHFYDRPILSLPFFDQIYRFLVAAAAGKELVLESWREGNLLSSLPIQVPEPFRSGELRDLLTPTHKAREISRTLGISPTFPKDFENAPAKDIELLHQLLTSGESREPAENFSIGVTVTNGDEMEAGQHFGTTNFPTTKKSYRIFDVTSEVDVNTTFTEGIIHSVEPIENSVVHRVTCYGAEGSEMILRRTSPSQ